MVWKYGDPIVVGGVELQVGSYDYDVWAELAEMVAGEDGCEPHEDDHPFDVGEAEWEDD